MTTAVSYRAWTDRITALAAALNQLKPLADAMGCPAPAETGWQGALFQKLLPQVQQDPFLVVAVTGGTNTGKSAVFNHLAGSHTSRVHPLATQTRHPVCSLPRGFLAGHNLAAVFPNLQVQSWTSEDDPLADGPDNLLIVREDPRGTQPERLLLFDTPDVDGVLRDNHRRAETISHAADVLVCVLTQQKYNDAAIREFFHRAALADKTVLIVFNMVHWPKQREVCLGWLKAFMDETQLAPVHVYAAPWDPEALEEDRLPFYPLSEGAITPREDLAVLHFDEIKIRSLRGSLKRVLDERTGLPDYLRKLANRSAQYAAARNILARDLRLDIVDLPQLPRQLVWDEIWKWLESRRTRFDRAVNGMYTAVGKMLTSWLRKPGEQEVPDFQKRECERLRAALAEFLDRLDTLRRGGNDILATVLSKSLQGVERRALFAELERRHDQMPMVTEDYRQFIRAQLDQFERENPRLVKGITWTLVSTAVVRPVVSVALFSVGAHGVELAAGHLVSVAGDIVVGAATAVTGEGLFAGASVPLQGLLNRVFSRFYVERAEVLAGLLHDLVLGPAVVELGAMAEVNDSPAYRRTLELVDQLRPDVTGEASR